MTKSLITLICTPTLEQSINDWLLEQETVSGFSSMTIHGHGSDPDKLSILEQVEGRKKQVMFQVIMNQENVDELISQLQEAFTGAKIHYWLTPILASGKI